MQKKMKQILGVVLLFCFMLAFSPPAWAAPAEGTAAFAYEKLYLRPGDGDDTITVFGFGSARGSPEEVQVSFGLTSYASQARGALEKHQGLVEKIAAHLQGKEVNPASITSLYFNVWPEYLYGDDTFREPEVIGYRVNSTISVHLTDILLVPEVIEAGLAAGANRLEGVRYFASPGLKQKALAAALEDGFAQAQGVAAALGRRVGRLLCVDQSLSPPYELWEERTPGPATGFQSQDLEINRSLRLVFCLE